MTNYNLN